MRTEAQWNECKRVRLEKKSKKFFAKYSIKILLNESGEIAPCIYFVQRENGGPIKIGCSANLPERITSLQRKCSDKLKVLLIIYGGFKKEKLVHKQFIEYR